MKKVIVLLSGGIDSAFAAHVLKEKGYEVRGLVLKIYEGVPSLEDTERIEVIKDILKIQIDFLDVREDFEKSIIQSFIESYKKGFTPNPCAVCNPEIKFKYAFLFKERLGYDMVASGHYADKGMYKGYNVLKKAVDKKKSQEYFLARLPSEYINNIVFPLASFEKQDIKDMARKIFPRLKSHPESQDVCFLRGIPHYEFFEKRDIRIEGNMVYRGRVVKEGVNLLKFTRGQRRGIEFAAGKRVYVKDIDVFRKTVELGTKQELLTDQFYIDEPIFYLPWDQISKCEVKVRYSRRQVPCRIDKVEKRFKVILSEPLYTVTQGQLAVLYHNEFVLASGWISF